MSNLALVYCCKGMVHILHDFGLKIATGFAKFRAWSVSPQELMCSLLSANQGALLHRMTRKLRVWDACSEFARNSLGIRSELGVLSEFARNSLRKRPGSAMRGTIQQGLVPNKKPRRRKDWELLLDQTTASVLCT